MRWDSISLGWRFTFVFLILPVINHPLYVFFCGRSAFLFVQLSLSCIDLVFLFVGFLVNWWMGKLCHRWTYPWKQISIERGTKLFEMHFLKWLPNVCRFKMHSLSQFVLHGKGLLLSQKKEALLQRQPTPALFFQREIQFPAPRCWPSTGQAHLALMSCMEICKIFPRVLLRRSIRSL